jgi:nitroreductase
MAVCSTKAIQIDDLKYGEDLFNLPGNEVTYSSFMDFLANRRSVRNYKNKPIPDELLDKVLESVSYAPFGSAPEKMHITVVNNRKIIENALPHVEAFLEKIPQWIDHPIASRMIKRKNSAEKFKTIKEHLYPIAKMGNYQLKYGDRITRHAPALIILHAEKDAEEHSNNSLIFACYMMLAAHSLGLGASLIGLVPPAINKVDVLKDIFKIPRDHESVISLILGYPKFKYKRAIRRQKANVEWLV